MDGGVKLMHKVLVVFVLLLFWGADKCCMYIVYFCVLLLSSISFLILDHAMLD